MTETARDISRLIIRVSIGGVQIAHGAQKLFGWFGGHGLQGTGAYLESQGFRPGRQSALAAGLGEAAGGALFALGLATPAGGAAIVGTMGVAAAVHAPQGFFATEGGMEYPAVLALMAGALTLIGPGNISLDQLLGGQLDRPWMRAAALAAAAAALAAVLTKRQRALAEQAALADQETSA